MTIIKARKKPIDIEAIKFDGTNQEEIYEWCYDAKYYDGNIISIRTLEGNMIASIGDYIIKGINGEFYPCDSDIFKKTYDVL